MSKECRKNVEARLTRKLSMRAESSLRILDFGFLSSFEIRPSSFAPQRLHRIDLRCAPPRPPAGQQRYPKQHTGAARESEHAPWFDLGMPVPQHLVQCTSPPH